MEYQIVVENDPFRMAKCINEMCTKGWEPVGSHSVAFEPGKTWYYSQPMIRKTPNTKDDLQNDTQHLQVAIETVEKAAIKCKMSQSTYDELMSLLEDVSKQTAVQ